MKATLFQPSPGIEIAICTYSEGDENSDTRSEFQVFLDKTIGIQTSYITCPKTDRRRAFTADFNTDYQNPQIRSVQPYGDAKFKFGQLPVGQGVDPLSNHIGLASANGKALTRACPYVGEAIEKEFGPFSDVCRKYFVLSKEAKVYTQPKEQMAVSAASAQSDCIQRAIHAAYNKRSGKGIVEVLLKHRLEASSRNLATGLHRLSRLRPECRQLFRLPAMNKVHSCVLRHLTEDAVDPQ
ncbi:hypothetical protein FOZ62_000948, partial [Perkinsus olseni]